MIEEFLEGNTKAIIIILGILFLLIIMALAGLGIFKGINIGRLF